LIVRPDDFARVRLADSPAVAVQMLAASLGVVRQ
jgi:hypothetical protein